MNSSHFPFFALFFCCLLFWIALFDLRLFVPYPLNEVNLILKLMTLPSSSRGKYLFESWSASNAGLISMYNASSSDVVAFFDVDVAAFDVAAFDVAAFDVVAFDVVAFDVMAFFDAGCGTKSSSSSSTSPEPSLFALRGGSSIESNRLKDWKLESGFMALAADDAGRSGRGGRADDERRGYEKRCGSGGRGSSSRSRSPAWK